eukprot:5480249-Amphidinium_carterae.1
MITCDSSHDFYLVVFLRNKHISAIDQETSAREARQQRTRSSNGLRMRSAVTFAGSLACELQVSPQSQCKCVHCKPSSIQLTQCVRLEPFIMHDRLQPDCVLFNLGSKWLVYTKLPPRLKEFYLLTERIRLLSIETA